MFLVDELDGSTKSRTGGTYHLGVGICLGRRHLGSACRHHPVDWLILETAIDPLTDLDIARADGQKPDAAILDLAPLRFLKPCDHVPSQRGFTPRLGVQRSR